jgi:hypothetical protein
MTGIIALSSFMVLIALASRFGTDSRDVASYDGRQSVRCWLICPPNPPRKP